MNQQRETVVRETWLSRKPRPDSLWVALVSTAILFLGSFADWARWNRADQWMPASQQEVFNQGQVWRLWTTIFSHADFGHLLSNCFLFFILGFFLYGYFGLRVFPFAALAWGGLISAVSLATYAPDIHLIGASGVVYWMGGSWLVFYFSLSRQKNAWHRILRTLGVALLLFMPSESISPNVSHRTHFIGFMLGALFTTMYYFWNREKFLAAEVREEIRDEDDPGDRLPGPEGFPTHLDSSGVHAALELPGSFVREMREQNGFLVIELDAIVHLSAGRPGFDSGHVLRQIVIIQIAEYQPSPESPLMQVASHDFSGSHKQIPLIDGDLKTETFENEGVIKFPFAYSGHVDFYLTPEAHHPLRYHGRGIEIRAKSPGRFTGIFSPGEA